MAEGIEIRHSRSCGSRKGGVCNCTPSYQAQVWSRREQRTIKRTFPSQAAAKRWRADAVGQLDRGTMKAPTKRTLKQAADAWLLGAEDGSITNRSGDPYKPSAIRSYRSALEFYVLPALGHVRLSEIQRRDLQHLADKIGAEREPSTVRNALMPLRAVFRRAVRDGEVVVNPTAELELPAVRSKRDRIADPEEAAKLLAPLTPADRALWATALYAGLRLGELRALKWGDIDLAAGVIHVHASWDRKEGRQETKNRRRRRVPLPGVLRDILAEHRLDKPTAQGLAFGVTDEQPFNEAMLRKRARKAWKAINDKEQKRAKQEGRKPYLLRPIGVHDSRHTFASLMIAAGVNAKALSIYMGHSSITITLDTYGHLMPGNEGEAAELLDAYLERADSQARIAAVSEPETAAVTSQ